MNTYRCTRSFPYQHEPAKSNKLARQGHYIQATSADDARQQMSQAFPDEDPDSFTVDLWSENVESVTVKTRED